MKKMLITGGTVFVSRWAALYFSGKYDVYVLNRNTRPQSSGVTLIEGDRHALGEKLHGYHFDVVVDTAYCADDVNDLLDALGSYQDYILISSSAVYPENAPQPFTEETPVGPNRFWGKYGTDKIEAEQALLRRVPGAYILRPPYLYGPENNIYREAFVFDCALEDRTFYLPGAGEQRLQFFHVEDLFRFAEILLKHHPKQHIFNVGNHQSVTIREWVTLCYQTLDKQPEFQQVREETEQRNFFPFYSYEYALDVSKQAELMPRCKDLADGLREALDWYLENKDEVRRKPLREYIDKNLRKIE